MLLVHRYYWPDVPPYAHMLRVIGEHLVGDGYDVTVFCGPVSYNAAVATADAADPASRIRVHRIRLPSDDKGHPLRRGLSMALFAVRLVAHVVRHRSRYDLMTVSTVPPVAMGAAANVVRRLTGLPYLYHCMDIYPEVLEVAGVTERRALLRWARRLDTASCRSAAAVITLSDDMKSTLVTRGIRPSTITVLNNFEIATTAAANVDEVLGDPNRFRITFAGNMGRFQGLDTIVDAARDVLGSRAGIEFLFMGSGTDTNLLRRRASGLADGGIRFVAQQPPEVAAAVLERSDLALVPIRQGMHRVAYPSKTATCLAAGCRLLAVVEPDSNLGRMVREHDLGSLSEPGDAVSLAAAIVSEVDRGRATTVERARLRAAAETFFGRQSRLAEWSRLVRQHARGRDD